jgi:adenylate cyclase class 2
MTPEIEVKFLNRNIEETREKLRGIDATCIKPLTLMRRAIIDYPDRRLQLGANNSFIRVRDEGDCVTLTFKQFQSLTIDGAKEISTRVDSFDDTIAIFKAIGLTVHSLQESKRETWSFRDCEIMLDEWPWLNPYIEVEGPDSEALQHVALLLNLQWEEGVYGDVMVAYRNQYPHLQEHQTIGNMPEVLFSTPIPDFFTKEN